MGAIIGKTMDENLRKNHEFMVSSQQAQLERQMHMQTAMLEQQVAMQLARSRDHFYFFATFYSTVVTGVIIGFRKTRNPRFLVPLFPMTFMFSYLFDMAYGGKMGRIRADADAILRNHGHLFALPLPTLDDIDRRSRQTNCIIESTEENA